jgi:hypothetical protein
VATLDPDRQDIPYGNRHVAFTHAEIDVLASRYPDAFLLLSILRRHHWDREFRIAWGMAARMPGGGWDWERFGRARTVLEKSGLVVLVSPANAHLRTAAVYRWPDASQGRTVAAR